MKQIVYITSLILISNMYSMQQPDFTAKNDSLFDLALGKGVPNVALAAYPYTSADDADDNRTTLLKKFKGQITEADIPAHSSTLNNTQEIASEVRRVAHTYSTVLTLGDATLGQRAAQLQP